MFNTLTNSRFLFCCSLIAGMVAIPEVLQAAGVKSASVIEAGRMAADPIEIMARSAGNATDSALASGTAILNQFLSGDAKFFVTTLGGGGIAGLAVGYTLKKVAKIFALVLGVTFISLQYLAYKNVVTIDWTKVQRAVDQQHLEKASEGLMSVITYNLPFAGSFLVGFWMGFKKG